MPKRDGTGCNKSERWSHLRSHHIDHQIHHPIGRTRKWVCVRLSEREHGAVGAGVTGVTGVPLWKGLIWLGLRFTLRDGRQHDADSIRKTEQGETLRPGLSAEGLTTCIVRVLLDIRRARRRG